MIESTPNTVDASPTKEFFISILTKDIALIPAIIDLIDNSLDGARRTLDDGNYNGLWIKMEFHEDYFKISDNCGGIPKKTALEYAFRFGRPEKFAEKEHSIGQFGIGMKRAFFKIGSQFKVDSYTSKDNFSVECDVEEWKKSDVDWKFNFSEINRDMPENGTSIVVNKLHKSISQEFVSDIFLSLLKKQIESYHRDSIGKGLGITVNGIPLKVDLSQLLSSSLLKPAFKKMTFHSKTKNPVNVKIYAGVAEGSPSEAGWYVFSNGRLLLEADKTFQSGWGEDKEIRIPQYHNTYAKFRGFVFFDSDDPKLLPCNTTKTGVDLESEVYNAVRLEMVKLMSPVIFFLRNIVKVRAKTDEDSEEIFSRVSGETSLSVLNTIKLSKFIAPTIYIEKKPKPKENRILYYKLKTEVDKIKRKLGVKTNQEVGEETFKYYIDMEIDN